MTVVTEKKREGGGLGGQTRVREREKTTLVMREAQKRREEGLRFLPSIPLQDIALSLLVT